MLLYHICYGNMDSIFVTSEVPVLSREGASEEGACRGAMGRTAHSRLLVCYKIQYLTNDVTRTATKHPLKTPTIPNNLLLGWRPAPEQLRVLLVDLLPYILTFLLLPSWRACSQTHAVRGKSSVRSHLSNSVLCLPRWLLSFAENNIVFWPPRSRVS